MEVSLDFAYYIALQNAECKNIHLERVFMGSNNVELDQISLRKATFLK
jgi:hypothetical protein